MSAETKIALALIALLALGIGLVAVGLGFTTRLAMVGGGGLLAACATWLLGVVWRGRQ